MMYRIRTLAATAILATAFAGAASAHEVVKVSLTGEKGEKMGAKATPDTVKAGDVVFEVTNDAHKSGHEMVVVKLSEAGQKLMVDPATDKIDEDKLKSMGEVSGLKPGQHGELEATLEPGNYILLCNYKGHFEAGMWTPFTVTP